MSALSTGWLFLVWQDEIYNTNGDGVRDAWVLVLGQLRGGVDGTMLQDDSGAGSKFEASSGMERKPFTRHTGEKNFGIFRMSWRGGVAIIALFSTTGFPVVD